MNENQSLTVFSSDVIPVYTTDEGNKVVIGRDLHEKLNISTSYKDWFPRMCEYGFTEPEDFYSFLSESTGGRPSTNHLLKLDMAKHIAMIRRSPQGKAIRDKLIALETNISQLSPELRTLINLEVQQKQQAKMLAETNRRLLLGWAQAMREELGRGQRKPRERREYLAAYQRRRKEAREHAG